MNQPLIPSRQDRRREAEVIVAKADPDTCRALFYLFTGRPDSKTQIFARRIILTPNDVSILDRKIIEKLQNHDISEVITSIILRFKNRRIVDFGSIERYQEFDWHVPERLEQLTIKWDFLVKLPHYLAPQRHTLSVKVSPFLRPIDLMRAVFSSDPDELDSSQVENAVCTARVDFLNHILADELLNIVDTWNDSVRRHPKPGDWLNKLESYDEYFMRGFQYATCFTVFMACLAFYLRGTTDITSDSAALAGHIRFSTLWLAFASIIVFSVGRLGKQVGLWSQRLINRYGDSHVFECTNGDLQHVTEIATKNQRCGYYFIGSCLLAVALNLVASWIAVYIWP